MEPVDLEMHQIERPYKGLRLRRPKRERALLASLAEHGQQAPIVVVARGERFVVIDGHVRVWALKRLAKDTVRAFVWAMSEVDALIVARALRTPPEETALEQGWLLAELHTSFGVSERELARRFDRSTSWVSRRLGLVAHLPEGVQELVRQGAIGAHAAMRSLLPLARANAEAALRIAKGIAGLALSSRDIAAVCQAWWRGSPEVRGRLLEKPGLYCRARACDATHAAERELETATTAFSHIEELLPFIDPGFIAGPLRLARSRLARLCARIREAHACSQEHKGPPSSSSTLARSAPAPSPGR